LAPPIFLLCFLLPACPVLSPAGLFSHRALGVWSLFPLASVPFGSAPGSPLKLHLLLAVKALFSSMLYSVRPVASAPAKNRVPAWEPLAFLSKHEAVLIDLFLSFNCRSSSLHRIVIC
jgi:hypothetical protein